MSLPLSKHERDFASLLWSNGPLSRRDVVERTGTHPTLVGTAATSLLKKRIARENPRPPKNASTNGHAPPPATPSGRPRSPLEIDPASRHVLGIAIQPAHVSAVQLNLLGKLLSQTNHPHIPGGGPAVVARAAELISQLSSESTLSVGVSVPGFVDPAARRLLLSAASPETRDLDLTPLYTAANQLPLTVHNDMHALAARWQLSNHAPTDEDVLLAWIDDGSIGASILLSGRPNRGCVTGAAELGHLRTPLPTPTCFCGRQGCLERVFSSVYLDVPDLAVHLAAYPDPKSITSALATSLADAANLLRPHRIVIASPYATLPLFASTLTAAIESNLLPGLAGKITLTFWPHLTQGTAETAAYLPLSSLYQREWT